MYVCMYVCVCMCMYGCMYVCKYMYVCVSILCVSIFMYVCVYIYMYVCMCICVYVCLDVCVCLCVYVWIYVYICMYVSMYVSILMPTSAYYQLSLTPIIVYLIPALSPLLPVRTPVHNRCSFLDYRYAKCVTVTRTSIVKKTFDIIVCTHTCFYVFILNIYAVLLNFICIIRGW